MCIVGHARPAQKMQEEFTVGIDIHAYSQGQREEHCQQKPQVATQECKVSTKFLFSTFVPAAHKTSVRSY